MTEKLKATIRTYQFVLGILCAFGFIHILLPRQEGIPPSIRLTLYPIMHNGMILIPVSANTVFHIHHWIIFGVPLTCYKCLHPFIISFCLCLTIQGLTYNDAFHIIQNNPY